MTQAEIDYYDDLLGRGPGDPDFHTLIRYIGQDKAVVELSIITNEPRDYGDNNPADPEQNWEESNEL